MCSASCPAIDARAEGATWKGAWFPRAASGLPGLLNARCARVDSGARQRLSPPDATSGRTGGPPLRRATPLHPRETGTDALRGGHPPPSSPPTPRSKPPGSTVRRSPYLTVFLLPFHADACDDATTRLAGRRARCRVFVLLSGVRRRRGPHPLRLDPQVAAVEPPDATDLPAHRLMASRTGSMRQIRTCK